MTDIEEFATEVTKAMNGIAASLVALNARVKVLEAQMLAANALIASLEATQHVHAPTPASLSLLTADGYNRLFANQQIPLFGG